MEEPLVKIHYWLYPISWIYGMGVRLRNKLFDWGYYRSKSFDVPVVCVGNLAVGGTGKTHGVSYQAVTTNGNKRCHAEPRI
jgi:tetraacyldisaccharide 4'-kinase